jgi:TonB family protein
MRFWADSLNLSRTLLLAGAALAAMVAPMRASNSNQAAVDSVPLQGVGWLSPAGARGQFFGGREQFCCPEYVTGVIERIRANWQPAGDTSWPATVNFTIERDGGIRDITIERSSGDRPFDESALRAVAQTQQVAPLPGGFPRSTLVVHLFVGPASVEEAASAGRSQRTSSTTNRPSYSGRWTLVTGSIAGHIPGLPPASELDIDVSEQMVTIRRDGAEIQTFRRDGVATDLTGYRRGTLVGDDPALSVMTTRVRPGNETVTLVSDVLAVSGDELLVTRTLRVERPAGNDLGVPQNRWEARYSRK